MRVTLKIGLNHKYIASGFGIGFSTLRRWIKEQWSNITPSNPPMDRSQKNEFLREDNRLLRAKRAILKKLQYSCAAKQAPPQRLYQIMKVDARDYRAYSGRVMSQSMVFLAYIRDPFVQNHAAFG